MKKTDKKSVSKRNKIEPERISQAECARRLGVTRGAVNQAVKSGRLTLEDDGKLIWEKAKEEWERNADIGQRREDSNEDWQAARTRRERAEADMAEIELKKLQRSVVSVEEAKKEFFDCSRLIRDKILQLPKRLAPMLVGLDQRNIAIKLQDELTAALAGLEKDILAG